MAVGDTIGELYTFTWDIVNPQYNPQRRMQSPNFTITPFTGVMWCLRVELLDPGNVYEIHCYLHRIPSMTGPDFILADFDLEVKGSFFQETKMNFQNVKFMNQESSPYVDDPYHIMKVIVLNEKLKLNFELRLVCNFTMLSANEQSNNLGNYYLQMKNLSENILSLLSMEQFSNIILRVQGRCFYAHKAIILARLSKLALAIPGINFPKTSEYEVIGITPTIMECLLFYAYTGTLSPDCYTHVREVYNAAEEYELKELQQLLKFSSNRCCAKTTMNIQRKSLIWNLEPNQWVTGIKQYLLICPGDLGHTEDLMIGYNISEICGEKFIELCFQFPKLDWGCPIFMNCNVICMDNIQRFFEEQISHLFISRGIWTSQPLCFENFLLGSPVTFRVEIDLCGSEGKSCIEQMDTTISTRSPLLDRKNIEKLSFDLGKLFLSSKCCDVTLKTQNLNIYAHKAILAARSERFLEIFSSYPDYTSFNFPRITDSTMKYIINYIYTGSTKEIAATDIQELKIVASNYNLSCLVRELSSNDDNASHSL